MHALERIHAVVSFVFLSVSAFQRSVTPHGCLKLFVHIHVGCFMPMPVLRADILA